MLRRDCKRWRLYWRLALFRWRSAPRHAHACWRRCEFCFDIEFSEKGVPRECGNGRRARAPRGVRPVVEIGSFGSRMRCWIRSLRSTTGMQEAAMEEEATAREELARSCDRLY